LSKEPEEKKEDETLHRLTSCFQHILKNLYKSVTSKLYLDSLRDAVISLIKLIASHSLYQTLDLYQELLLIYLVTGGRPESIPHLFIRTPLKHWIQL
jgi:hypothetical protein